MTHPSGEIISSLNILERMNAAFDRMIAASLARDDAAFAKASDEFRKATPRKG